LNPSLTLRDGNVDRGVGFVMRGVGTRSFNTGIEPSVNVVIDGVVNGIQAQNIADLADIERIEILRGPQGTLFGKNSTAGVISITTKAPSEELEGNLSVGYGSNEEVKIKGTISNSLSDNVGARLSFYSNSTDGYLDNVSTGPKNEIDEYGLRGKVVFNMSDDSSLRVTANYSDRDSNCCYWVPRVAAPGSGFANRIAPVIASETNNEINLANDFSQFNDITSTGISVQYDSAFNAFDLVAIAAWSDWESDVNTDVDSSPVDLIDINGGLFTSQHKTFELRLQSNGSTELQWLAGYFYADQFNDGKQDIGSFTSQLLGNPETPSNFGTLTEFEQDITNWATLLLLLARL
jgi:iron complex outermembrane receptor protein